MNRTSLFHRAILLVPLLGCTTVLQADPITYVESGIASGMIGGSSFSGALVQVTVTGDTNNVVPIYGGLAFANPASSTTVTIAGIGTATVTDPTEIQGIPTPISIDTGFPVVPYIIIGTVDSPPSLESITGLGAAGDNALLGYDLATSIGPIT